MIKIKISNDFSDTPGGRYIEEGEYSGEAFRDHLLIGKINKAELTSDKVYIDFDGCFGFGTSFLEEAFGGLVRKYHKKNVLDYIQIHSTEDETIPQLVKKYIKDAEAENRE